MGETILALAGGVGGAKLALGLSRVVTPGQLVICVNTGDDETFHGLHICPDLDTVMYTLASLANPLTGWGLDGDTFNTLGMLREYGVDAWFNLGDRDLATHIRRTQLLRQGAGLSEATAELCNHLGIAHQVAPMSDDPVRTVLSTDSGELPMQDYFVRRRAEPRVLEVRYDGAESARPSPVLEEALEQAQLIVLCPSNPFLSLGPILALPGISERLANAPGLRVAVSPIIGGAAVRGPAAKIMSELGQAASCVGIAKQYQGLCDVLLIDDRDAHLSPAVAELGIKPVAASIIMDTEADKVKLAERILAMRAE
jgi:LPPG:FO 2-phospho-L-lactate transferase